MCEAAREVGSRERARRVSDARRCEAAHGGACGVCDHTSRLRTCRRFCTLPELPGPACAPGPAFADALAALISDDDEASAKLQRRDGLLRLDGFAQRGGEDVTLRSREHSAGSEARELRTPGID